MKIRQFDTSNRFLVDTAFHRMEIIRDDGLYRHLRMKQPGTSCYYFDIITWPGYLTVTGDMGTWTFSRINDMFNFFGRWDGEINTGYWSEKLEAGACCSARELLAKDFDEDEFSESLKEYFSEYLEGSEPHDADGDDEWNDDRISDSDKRDIREIVSDLCSANFSNEHDAYQAVYDADWPEGFSAWDICDGLTFKTYTSHFRWILFAITWAISKYHNTKLVDKAMVTYLAVKGVAA
ncbi:hypothetical protein [Citrobacter freundii]|uniref:hypothetical protein n=1 Tax=Citrobacter freundii TaxID=546 RepID=UPI002433A477|nr:hypothetical protein [Citrobacter freundii]EKU4670077.1 hypothetical protein [Citrobacter freundii]MEB1002168.1 hypothetical protein [Citrobacter freundii]WGA94602.1 hypothetical protein NFL15_06225 [Citrobacter freundii]